MLLQPALLSVAAFMSSVAAQGETITAIPSPSSSSTYSAQAYSFVSKSFSGSFTYTTATTAWSAPTFATPRPIPSCSDAVCPAYGGAACVDADGILYGIICNTRLGGIIIVDSGKLLKERDAAPEPAVDSGGALEARSYTGTFVGCTGFCNTYKTYCVGVSYERGACQAFDLVSGNFPGPGFAAMRLN